MTRELTNNEMAVLNHLKNFERLIDEKRLSIALMFKPESAARLAHEGIRLVSCEYDRVAEMYKIRLTLTEYKKYLDLMCKQIGMTVEIDGSVKTYDGLTVTLEENAG